MHPRVTSMVGTLRFAHPTISKLLPRRLNVDLPRDRWSRMALEEALRGPHQLLGVGRILLHPGFAGGESVVGGIADADEAEPLGFLQRGQAGGPQFTRRE